MDLEELLRAMDRTAANLSKLESVWERARPFIPDGPQCGAHPAYEDLAMAWADLLPGLPPIDGWTITDPLPDIAAMGQSFIDFAEIGELPDAVHAAAEEPGADIAAYRYRLARARFTGGTVSFRRAQFSGGTVHFGGEQFSGGTVDFTQATGSAPSGLVPPSEAPLPSGLSLPSTWYPAGSG